MLVIKASTAGFCMGVSLAVRKLEKALETGAGEKLYTLGPIIHNPRVVRDYEGRGALCLADPDLTPDLPGPGACVVIRAHGLPQDQELKLRRRGLRIVDATCPRVKSAQLSIAGARESGKGELLLFGEQDHPEVRGLLSYAGPGAQVFSSLEELRSLPLDREGKYFMAAQTTQDSLRFEEALVWARAFFRQEPPALRTICAATRQRQEDVIRLAGQVKSMVIVGGMNSGNTRRLAEISAGLGIFTVHCEEAWELPLEKLRLLQPVGLSAGASSPEEQINAVERILVQG